MSMAPYRVRTPFVITSYSIHYTKLYDPGRPHAPTISDLEGDRPKELDIAGEKFFAGLPVAPVSGMSGVLPAHRATVVHDGDLGGCVLGDIARGIRGAVRDRVGPAGTIAFV